MDGALARLQRRPSRFDHDPVAAIWPFPIEHGTNAFGRQVVALPIDAQAVDADTQPERCTIPRSLLCQGSASGGVPPASLPAGDALAQARSIPLKPGSAHEH